MSYLTAATLGVVAWLVSAEVVMGVIILAATGPPLGPVFEQARDTKPLTTRQRRLMMERIVGVVVGALVLEVVVLT